MNFSKLTKRIVIQEKFSTSVGDEGYIEDLWVNKYRPWARCIPVSATEQHKTNTSIIKGTMKFNIRYKKDLSYNNRIHYAGKFYKITSIENVDEANVEMYIIGEVIE